jgi:hypothetical protein
VSDTAQTSTIVCDRQSSPQAGGVREQLERLLNDPLFMHSKHFPNMLRYVVEQTLEGNTPQIRERIIGIEVFGRGPGYDTNADPVVRMTAREIRNRLARYYQDPSHSSELRIDLPTGSYVPTFCPKNDVVLPHEIASVTVPGRREAGVRLRKIGFTLLLFALGLSACVLLVLRLHDVKAPPNALNSFWEPFVQGNGLITICMGDPKAPKVPETNSNLLQPSNAAPKPDPQATSWSQLRSGNLALGDVDALSRVLRLESFHNKPYRLAMAPEVSFAQLQEGPILLIGAFDNRWMMRLTENLRFHFITTKDNIGMIADRRNPGQTTWSISNGSYHHFSRDFAIVARFHDATTNQPIVAIGGFSEQGTEAAGEILSDSAAFSNLLKNAPSNWRSMNMEAVIATDILTGQPGPPQVLAVEFW